MTLTKIALAGAAALTLIGVAGTASARPWDHDGGYDHARWEYRHDRYDEGRREERIREERREAAERYFWEHRHFHHFDHENHGRFYD
jgi:hypothetical protein